MWSPHKLKLKFVMHDVYVCDTTEQSNINGSFFFIWWNKKTSVAIRVIRVDLYEFYTVAYKNCGH